MKIKDLQTFILVLLVTAGIAITVEPPFSYIICFIWGMFAQSQGWMFE